MSTVPTPCSSKRRHAWRFGRLSEALCRWRLRLSGYRIIARDMRTRVGEIDLIARRGGTIAFIEVKARSAESTADLLTARQRQRIVRAAEAFLAGHPEYARCTARFDLMLVSRRHLPRHLRGAFRADD